MLLNFFRQFLQQWMRREEKKISHNLNPQQCKPKNALARDIKCDFEGFIFRLVTMICQFYNSFTPTRKFKWKKNWKFFILHMNWMWPVEATRQFVMWNLEIKVFILSAFEIWQYEFFNNDEWCWCRHMTNISEFFIQCIFYKKY